MPQHEHSLVAELAKALQERGVMLATAESCTGGGVAYAITAIPGSSHWFDRGFVVYTNAAKSEMLGVDASIIDAHGAVSEQVARALAEGVLTHSHADFSLAITGVAGPGGGSPEKPVGTVWFAWAGTGSPVLAERRRFSGNRDEVRQQSVEAALQGMLDYIQKSVVPA
ncbi:MAG: CinA family protein [Gammaproteobacteria bacterium]|nr:CinA family protein [Gammaproteobacteria bacterium]